MKDFRNLKVWEKAHQLTLSVYQITQTFPKEESYGLKSQIRRACASIPANSAEGCDRDGNVELARFFQIAMGSASELKYHLLLACALKLIEANKYELLDKNIIEIKCMLNFFLQKLKTNR